jgi:hypothetical protein
VMVGGREQGAGGGELDDDVPAGVSGFKLGKGKNLPSYEGADCDP